MLGLSFLSILYSVCLLERLHHCQRNFDLLYPWATFSFLSFPIFSHDTLIPISLMIFHLTPMLFSFFPFLISPRSLVLETRIRRNCHRRDAYAYQKSL